MEGTETPVVYRPSQPSLAQGQGQRIDPADRECLERFLNIQARYITDGQGVVSGVLLVTPNALMFDPNVSDPLVIEHGVDYYGVTIPMELVLRAAMYTDIAHMRVKNTPVAPVASLPKAEVYYAPGEKSSDQPQANANCEVSGGQPIAHHTQVHQIKQHSIPETGTGESLKRSLCMTRSTPEDCLQGRKDRGALTPSPLSNEPGSVEKRRSPQGESRREQMLKRLSNPVESLSSYTKSGINKVLSTPKNVVDFSTGLVKGAKDALTTSVSKGDSLENDLEVFDRTATTPVSPNNRALDNRTSIGYQNMVDAKVDVFANWDKLIPRPARSCDDPPLYLCLRMGRPSKQNVKKYSPAIFSFGKKKLEREYWFSVPKAKADNFCHFFMRWAPEIYGDVYDLQGTEERGLTPIETDEEEEEEEENENQGNEESTSRERREDNASGENVAEKSSRPKFWRRRGPLNFLKLVEGHFTTDGESPGGWEVVSMNDAQRPFIEMGELPLPDLLGTSDILTEDHRRSLCKTLPPRAQGYAWSLLYSSSKHGFSLKTIYREMVRIETPVLMVIQDTSGTVFGAFSSCALRMSDLFYGTGETYLFTFHPEFQHFPWTGENLYFIKGNSDSLAIGAGDGNFGLWLDGDLCHGRSNPCKTFDNLRLSQEEDFVMSAIECWGFVLNE